MIISKMELFNALIDERLKNAILLVFANKQDVHGASLAANVCESLNLSAIKDRPWHIQGCCALSGTGLNEGMDWIAATLQQTGEGTVRPPGNANEDTTPAAGEAGSARGGVKA
eukprot:GHVT01096288.1.p2 GENE.GHVT01096288.1~~GHVT01096288.1.p2  ORF type:complete len:113 (-),score=28.02 GHVT01096288.1:113-451(-)